MSDSDRSRTGIAASVISMMTEVDAGAWHEARGLTRGLEHAG